MNDYYNPAGNKFGTPERGDSMQIRLWVFNYGDSIATNVSATLSCMSPYVTVVEPYVTFPIEGIPGHHQSLSAGFFKVYFHWDMPKGSIIPFTVVLSSNQGSFVDGFNIREGDLLSVLELSEVDKYIINEMLSYGCRVIVPSRYLLYDQDSLGNWYWKDYAYEHGSGGRSVYFGIDPLDNGVWAGGGLDGHTGPMSWFSLTPLNQWPFQWRYLFQQGYEVAIVPEILEPRDSAVYYKGDTIDFRVQWTMSWGSGQEQWIEEYKINSGDYPPGMHTFKAVGWSSQGPACDSVTLCIFDFYIRENLVKKYFNPLKPDSARIVYALVPQRYANPDSSPNPIGFQVEIKDKDGNLVYGPRNLTPDEQRAQALYWDGRDNGGQVVDLAQYPFTAELTLYYRETKGRQLWQPVRRPTLLNPYVVSIVQPQPLDTFWINETPMMPAVHCEARVEGIFGDITYYPFIRWFWRVKEIWHPINTTYRFLDSTYTAQPLIGIPTYNCQPDRFNGDSIWLKVKIEVPITEADVIKDSVDEHRGYIRGLNPSRAVMSAYFANDTLRAIGWKESEWTQFYNASTRRGLPIQGPDGKDIGIMQIRIASHPDKFPQAGWNWRANIDAGRDYFATCYANAQAWAQQHPDAVYHNWDSRNEMYDTYDHILRDAFCRYNAGPGHTHALYNEDGTIRDETRWNNYVCPTIDFYLNHPWNQ